MGTDDNIWSGTNIPLQVNCDAIFAEDSCIATLIMQLLLCSSILCELYVQSRRRTKIWEATTFCPKKICLSPKVNLHKIVQF